MTKDQLTQLITEAGFHILRSGNEQMTMLTVLNYAHLEKFAELVASMEREACAKVCDDLVLAHPGRADLTAQQCAFAIRERGAP